MIREAIPEAACRSRSKTASRNIRCAAALAVLFALAGCGGGWVIPEPQDPAAVRERRAARLRPEPPPRGEDTGDASPFARSQPLSPVARLLAHDIRVRLDARTLGYTGSGGFDPIEVYVAALDEAEYAAAAEMYSSPEAAAALFRPDTAGNRERFHRQATGSAETLHFQPNGPAVAQIGRSSRFWSSAAEKNAVGLFLAANLPGGGVPVRLLSLEKGAWPGRRVDLSLSGTGWTVLSSQRRSR